MIRILSYLECVSLSVPSILYTLSSVPPTILEYARDIPTLGVQPFFVVLLCMDSMPVKLTISPVTSGILMSFDDQKWFERFIYLDPSKFSVMINEDSYEFLISY